MAGAPVRRVLVTGSRDWADEDAVHTALLDQLLCHTPRDKIMVVVHGHASSGADAIAHAWAAEHPSCGVIPEAHPADWPADCGSDCHHHRRRRYDGSTYCPRQGHLRNQKMVDLGAHVCLAFPQGKSSGTRDCMRRAKAAGIEVLEPGK